MSDPNIGTHVQLLNELRIQVISIAVENVLWIDPNIALFYIGRTSKYMT